MIYLLLSKQNSHYQKLIVKFFKENILYNSDDINIEYKIIYNNPVIIESNLISIEKDDIVIWSAIVAYRNLDLVKTYKNSVVILEKPTILIQKISEENPINESTALNNGFYLMYITDKSDITNKEWKLILQKENYLIDVNDLLKEFKIQKQTEIKQNELKSQTKQQIDKQIFNNKIKQINYESE